MVDRQASGGVAQPRVFVVRGDLLDTACDHVVIPTDRHRFVEPYWHDHLRGAGIEVVNGIALSRGAADGNEGRERVHGPYRELAVAGSVEPRTLRTTWLVAAADAAPEEQRPLGGEDLETLDLALGEFRDRFLKHHRAQAPVGGRTALRPVVAMPLLGSGQGGFRQRMRAYAHELMGRLTSLAADLDADVVVVVHGASRHAAAWLETCRRALRDGPVAAALSGGSLTRRSLGLVSSRWCVGQSARPGRAPVDATAAIDLLRRHSAAGSLVPFFGSGVSLASSAPSWSDLLGLMERRHGVTPVGSHIDPFDRAQILLQQIGEEELRNQLLEAFSGLRPNVLHLLLAGLEARDAVTTNFDRLYEEAVNAGFGEVLSVIPMEGAERRLLKLHGSLPIRGANPVPGHPVLTREDVIEHGLTAGVLRGALQMLLLTGHVLFVGYGMGDPSLYQALFEIRRIRRSAGLQGAGPVATALMAVPAQDLSRLWGPDVTVLWPDRAATEDPAVGGSYIAELLDLLVDERAFGDVPVLTFRNEELTPTEQRLRQLLDGLRQHYDEVGHLPPEVATLLRRYGASS